MTTLPSATTPPDDVGALLATLRSRQRRLNALRWAFHGTLTGAALGVIAAGVAALTSAPGLGALAALFALVTAAGAGIGVLVGALLPVSDLHLARALDRAAASDDRFASAVQLSGNHHRDRVGLVIADALARVRATPVAAALPVRVPITARWLPAPLIALGAVMLLAPGLTPVAAAPSEPEISADDWRSIHEDFAKELAKLPKPVSAEDEQLLRDLEKLAEMLKERPDKMDALREIARLSDRVERQQKALGSRSQSMKAAAKSVASSEALQKFAAQLAQGDYQNAANELQKLSQQLESGEVAPTAEEFEAMAKDLERLAEQSAQEQELQKQCQSSASAAQSMNAKELAEALKRYAEQMKQASERLSQCDNAGQCRSMLDELKRRMNSARKGSGKKPGFCDGDGEGGGKGGLKAGWGSAAKWDGGSIKPRDEERTPELASTQERPGMSNTFKILSPDEKAQSARTYEELYAEFVHKAEADLDLDAVPLSQREFLKRYFRAIRPTDPAPAQPADPAAPPSLAPAPAPAPAGDAATSPKP
jgi:chemotaxis protein histidine kinase CheA